MEQTWREAFQRTLCRPHCSRGLFNRGKASGCRGAEFNSIHPPAPEQRLARQANYTSNYQHTQFRPITQVQRDLREGGSECRSGSGEASGLCRDPRRSVPQLPQVRRRSLLVPFSNLRESLLTKLCGTFIIENKTVLYSTPLETS